MLTPKQIVKLALRKKLGIVAVTDHDTVRGGVETLKLAEGVQGVIVVPGVEVKTSEGDVVALFIEEEVKRRGFFEVVDEVVEEGGILVLPHPYRGHEDVEGLARCVDAVEVLNSRSSRCQNLRAAELARRLGKPMVAGSDAHSSFELGRAYTLLALSSLSLEEVKRAILRGGEAQGRESPQLVHLYSTLCRFMRGLRRFST